MKTKNPKCIKCGNVMKTIYTKRSYKLDGKYKTYWNKEGYICSHLYYPFVVLKPHKKITNHLVSVYDVDIPEILNAIRKISKLFI